MNTQQVLDKVSAHMLNQGQKSMAWSDKDAAMMCAYRGDGGLQCAAGCMIPDDKYEKRFEGCGVRPQELKAGIHGFAPKTNDANALRLVLIEANDLDENGLSLLRKLQGIHDKNRVKYWKENLENLARREGLEWNFANFEFVDKTPQKDETFA